MRTNVTAFYNDYTDFQARVSRSVTSPTQPVPAIDFAVLNAGGLEIYGAELEFLAFPVPELRPRRRDRLSRTPSTRSSSTFAARPGQSLDRSWQTPAFSPEWTMRFGGAYEWALGDMGSLTLGASARFRSELALAVDNANLVTPRAIYPGMWQDDYWLYDAQLVWANDNQTLLAGLYGRNLSDEVYKTDAQEFSSVGGIRTAYFGAPQTVSFKITVRY